MEEKKWEERSDIDPKEVRNEKDKRVGTVVSGIFVLRHQTMLVGGKNGASVKDSTAEV
jgi:hypothetical protein